MARQNDDQETVTRTRDQDSEDGEKDFQNAEQWIRKQRVYPREKKAADLLNHLLARRGFAADESQSELQGVWDSVVGVGIANHSRVAAIRRGVLEVIVANSSLSQHLSIEKRKIVQNIQQLLPKTNIVDLRFRVGSIG